VSPFSAVSPTFFYKKETSGLTKTETKHRSFPEGLCSPSTLDRDIGGHFRDCFSQGSNLLFALCMSAELLNFEDSRMKLDVANLHLQISFVHTGACTDISGDKRGMVSDSSWAMR
jgi:hypothetical protein